jgi:AraC-like DNA-binding protein
MNPNVDATAKTPNGFASFADFYRNSRYRIFPQEHRGSETDSFRAFSVDQQAHDNTDEGCPDFVLGFPLNAGCRTSFNFGYGWTGSKRRRGDILLVPPRAEVKYRVDGAYRLLVVTWREGALRQLDPEGFDNEARPLEGWFEHYVRDRAVEAMSLSIWRELARTDHTARLFLDSALAHLAAALLRGSDRAPAPRASTIAPFQLKRAIAFIDNNLDRDIGLAEISGASGLSMFHFCRGFRAATGRPPYRFLLERRLARACELLASSRLPIAGVASTCGFSSQTRLNDAFRRYLGTTPRTYRVGSRALESTGGCAARA